MYGDDRKLAYEVDYRKLSLNVTVHKREGLERTDAAQIH